jgi:hypothetical protein
MKPWARAEADPDAGDQKIITHRYGRLTKGKQTAQIKCENPISLSKSNKITMNL